MSKKERIVVNIERLSIEAGNNNDNTIDIKWTDVYKATFYKLELKNSINRYLVFYFQYGEFVEIFDGMEGFDKLINELPKYLQLQIPNLATALSNASPKDKPVEIYRWSKS